MIDALIEFDFIRYSFISGILIGLLAPLIGTFIVVRRLSLIADALSHVTLGGIAFGMLLTKLLAFTINPVWTGILFSIAGSLMIEKLRSVYKHYQELAIPIIMSLGIGLSVIFISFADGFNQDLFGYLFGSISAVTFNDVIVIFSIFIVVVLFIGLLYKELFILSFDEEYASIIGVPRYVHILFMLMVALVISASMRVVGILLVSSLITLPVASAMRLTRSYKELMVWSVVIGEFAVITGLVTAFYLDITPGGVIVMLLVAILILSIMIKKNKEKAGNLNEN
ncbi:metal ABC transporter permease [Macrococcoides caseolyticum]|uniref:Metal ABC transporter permease n=1 Tax=Macrococcoides caseolyticum TaxID=69966 RepID=A0A855GQ20_9STAP|nr:metal ABC transporter permease [Macrococcus caseolyticus]MDJ1088264.1 metal ABC transporter permease [Macrococcus caseolyticus]MDJ1090929.1 metal ABC transporter permease [Macrococcus caseolyticus]MDJ1108802.1 metal ABC transporter permease [Macrococcus caseolyticus]MDJ1152464.1 metal ABC transporter permease [Macrococcus caseolyticus]PKD98973.1 metal ABC transporter permease [Macrococcus caseolyticus]